MRKAKELLREAKDNNVIITNDKNVPKNRQGQI